MSAAKSDSNNSTADLLSCEIYPPGNCSSEIMVLETVVKRLSNKCCFLLLSLPGQKESEVKDKRGMGISKLLLVTDWWPFGKRFPKGESPIGDQKTILYSNYDLTLLLLLLLLLLLIIVITMIMIIKITILLLLLIMIFTMLSSPPPWSNPWATGWSPRGTRWSSRTIIYIHVYTYTYT